MLSVEILKIRPFHGIKILRKAPFIFALRRNAN